MDQDEDVDMDQDMDPYDLADPVDITAKLPGNFYELLVKYFYCFYLSYTNPLSLSSRFQKNGRKEEKRWMRYWNRPRHQRSWIKTIRNL